MSGSDMVRQRGAMGRVLSGESVWPPPLWLMRQAGRYLPEYKALRARSESFLSFCYDPAMACEATLQPVRRFGFDAAIIFSDILVVPDALGRKVRFVEGEGPRLDPIEDAAGVARLPEVADWRCLDPTVAAIAETRAALPASTALLGFCGAPWTVATYMIAGRGTPDQAPARLFAYREPEAFGQLIDRLVSVSAAYLVAQLRAGADAVQIFDSWAGVLPPAAYRRWCVEPVAAVVAAVRAEIPDAPVIVFSRGAAAAGLGAVMEATGCTALGMDTTDDPAALRLRLGPDVALQGNLDPLVLMAGGKALDAAIGDLLSVTRGTRFIANLGHGILQHTPIGHVERLVERIRAG